ncbi:unnamed protein product [Haemonchus placei]|uniref:Tektin n=1 Tax=Haemonchus placei TaxID=6290 RepID=A0A0N4VZA4_HAEPC|nr:unnamed protein product [Haemonchus placei]
MARAELILNRRESNEDELRASLNDMADCEVVLRDWNSKRLRALRERWKAKRQEFELWQKEMDHLQSIAVTVENRQSLNPSLIAELQSIEESCDQMTMTELAHPLRLAIRQLRVVLENSFKERLESLKMAGEEDCTVAHNIVQVCIYNDLFPNTHTLSLSCRFLYTGAVLRTPPQPTGSR